MPHDTNVSHKKELNGYMQCLISVSIVSSIPITNSAFPKHMRQILLLVVFFSAESQTTRWLPPSHYCFADKLCPETAESERLDILCNDDTPKSFCEFEGKM